MNKSPSPTILFPLIVLILVPETNLSCLEAAYELTAPICLFKVSSVTNPLTALLTYSSEAKPSTEGMEIVKSPAPNRVVPFIVFILVPETNLSCFLFMELFTVLISTVT